ncbi:MAG: arylsulfatase [Kordiimonadaceae bacterium]|nr:arylsulfatase [Kordiimonadaceae bacterium]MBT6032092.1 arylsulfatase [Kordiimonadaceae bacterium]
MIKTLSNILISALIMVGLLFVSSCDQPQEQGTAQQSMTDIPPNIIYILADDLGYAELGSYGQEKIMTPSLDQMASEGMRFTQHYAGSTVCAPSRSVLMTGQDTGRTYVRGNMRSGEGVGSGQTNIKADTRTLGAMLQEQGYKTAVIGKWGLGSLGGVGHPNKMGFDHFYGYLDQRAAHNYYPEYLWRNTEKIDLRNPPMPRPASFEGDINDINNYAEFKGPDYAGDLIGDEVISFIKENKDQPFFVFYALTVPHAALQVPDEELVQYEGKFEEEPYMMERGYYPHIRPRSAHAAQITRMDRRVGQIMDLLKENNLDENTIVIFTSDNGPAVEGGMDQEFFDGNGIYRGVKRDLYEGGIRVPMIARWPGKIEQNSTSDHVSAFWDVMATFADISSGEESETSHGISFLPALTGNGEQGTHESLYWEFHEGPGKQAVRMGKWKGIRLDVRNDQMGPIELYNLEDDPSETINIAAEHPEIIKKIDDIMDNRERSEFDAWNFE